MVHSSLQDPETDGEIGDSGMLTGEFGAVPFIELHRVPGPLVLSTGSELPLHRAVGLFGTDVGELGVDGSLRSVASVDPNMRICMMAPCRPKNIHKGCEQSTQTCIPVLTPL